MAMFTTSTSEIGHAAQRGADLVCVVEDDDGVRRCVVTLLELEGFEVKAWEDGETFLRDSKALRPACLVLDIELPGMNGLAVAERLNGSGAGLPLIFMSGSPDLLDVAKDTHAEAEDFLLKPFSMGRLANAVRRSVRARDKLEYA